MILDVEKNKVIGNSNGIKKTVDENSLSLLLDVVQVSQYSTPERSTVREQASNAVDSQREKERAIEILTGVAKVEDYYLHREDVKYRDSNFDPTYYDLKWLDTENNRVELTYKSGFEQVGWCDKFIVKDYGVGLGGKRLESYLTKIGWSSKRNTTGLGGGFGIGSRVSLSLRNDYYTTETCYNGMKFKFNIYSYKVDNLIGKFNIQTNEENPYIIFSNGERIYYELTNSLNYTEITTPCKVHHKDKIKQAIKEQLLYFSNIDFTIINKTGIKEIVDFKATILYDSPNLVVSEQYIFSKPHVLIIKDDKSKEYLSYGYVNFRDLELQDLFGNVGLKAKIRQTIRGENDEEIVIQEGIDVSSSRETVIWSDNTRTYIKKQLEIATEEANALIENQLREDDFLVWLDKAKNILSNIGGNEILRQLSHIIDKTQLSPVYHADTSIRYGDIGLLLWGLNLRNISKRVNRKTNKEEIIRSDIDSWRNFDACNCYLQLGSTSLAKDYYLTQTTHSFITIRLLDDESLYSYVKKDEVETTINPDGSITTSTKPNSWTKDYVDKLIKKRDKIVELIKKSALFKSYEDVLIPEDWNKKFEVSESITRENEKEQKLTPFELRKLSEQTIVHSLEKLPISNKTGLPFKWKKNTIKISDLKEDLTTLYYSYGKDDSIAMATIILQRMYQNIDKIKFYRISKAIPKRLLKNHKHIDYFFKQETNIKKTMAHELVEWTTAKYIKENLDQLKFMRNYRLFNQEIADLYREVKDYSIRYYADDFRDFTDKYPTGKTFINGILDYTSKVVDLQLFIRDHKEDAQAIQQKSNELFGIETITESIGYNLEMYDKLQILLNYAEPIKALFNHIDLLKDIKNPEIEADTESMIREVLAAKDLTTFQVPFNKPINSVEEILTQDIELPMVQLKEEA